ncbi:MAG: ABC transporter ATP-binding protein [Candidatus Omnitrophota bacterium]
MSLICSVKNLTRIYHQKDSDVAVNALDGVSMEITDGDFAAIAGPSGSGKTTLLNILGGLDTPTAGEVIIDKTDLTKLSAPDLAEFRLRKIGFVFQAYNLIGTLSAYENAEYVALLQGVPQDRRLYEAKQLFKDLGMEPYLRRRPSQLSAGQQQRVAVARAIMARPKIILADEPTANLDSKTGSDLIELMHAMNKHLGITFVFATHDRMVMEKAGRLIQLHDGKLAGDSLGAPLKT